jgi:hypothetical protein
LILHFFGGLFQWALLFAALGMCWQNFRSDLLVLGTTIVSSWHSSQDHALTSTSPYSLSRYGCSS